MPTKLGGGAGGRFPFGVTPPEGSKEFTDPGNFSMQLVDGSTLIEPDIKGRIIPAFDDPKAALTVLVSGDTFGRALWPSRTQQWTANLNTYLGGNARPCVGLYFDPLNNFIYTASVDTNNNRLIVKLDASSTGGTFTTVSTNLALSAEFNSIMSRLSAYRISRMQPLDPANPDTSNWEFVYRRAVAGEKPRRLVADIINSTIISDEVLKYDSSGTNQELDVPVDYVSKNNDVILYDFKFINGATSNKATFYLVRGNSLKFITLSVPDGLGSIGPLSEQIMFVPWGNSSVVAIGENGTNPVQIYGRRLFDRNDFDRWLNEVADFHDMAPAEAYF